MTSQPELARDLITKATARGEGLSWPTDPTDQARLARSFLGRQTVARLDNSIEWADDLLRRQNGDEPRPARRNELVKRREYFQAELAELTDAQRRAIHHLIREAATMTLFGILVGIDQPDLGEIRVELAPDPESLEAHSIRMAPDPQLPDLHDELQDWILSFSKYRDEQVSLEQTRLGWQFAPVKYYEK